MIMKQLRLDVLALAGLYLIPPVPKRKAAPGDQEEVEEGEQWPTFPGEVGPTDPLIPEGVMLRGLKESDACRISREIGPVFCIDFTTRTHKPQQLFPARFGGRRCPVGVLELVNGKDGVPPQSAIVTGCGSKVAVLQESKVAGLHGFKAPTFQNSGTKRVLELSMVSRLQRHGANLASGPKEWRFPRFEGSKILGVLSSKVPEFPGSTLQVVLRVRDAWNSSAMLRTWNRQKCKLIKRTTN